MKNFSKTVLHGFIPNIATSRFAILGIVIRNRQGRRRLVYGQYQTLYRLGSSGVKSVRNKKPTSTFHWCDKEEKDLSFAVCKQRGEMKPSCKRCFKDWDYIPNIPNIHLGVALTGPCIVEVLLMSIFYIVVN